MYSYKEEKRNVDEQGRSMSRSTMHLVMDSGAPITRRTRRVFKHNCAKTITGENLLATVCIFWAYTRIFLAIASGATPIGSTGHAPDDNESTWIKNIKGVIDYLFVDNTLRLHCRQNKDRLLPSGVIYKLSKDKLEYFVHFNSQTRLRHMILELHHRDETRMPWLKHIVKVRPQDPSYVAWYTHMNALC
jgi:hypothetical protein